MSLRVNTQWRKYVIQTEDNLKSDTPVSCRIKPLSGAERRQLAFSIGNIENEKFLEQLESRKAMLDVISNTVLQHSEDYENVVIDGVPESATKAFVTHAPEDWVTDVFNAIMAGSVMTEAEQKK